VQTPVAPTPTVKPVPVPTATPVPLPPPTGQTTYVVKSGDWLWKIAREKGVSAQAIAAANPGIDVNLLRPGQTLIIPAPGSTPPPAVPGGGTGQVVHVVQQGENLFRIALKYNKSYQAIAVANGITNVNMIYPGQKLVIP
jgi:LysM repeat protein